MNLSRVRASRPALPLGVSVTFGGIPDPRITDLVDDVDVLYMTYYFIGNELGGQPAEDVPGDLARMVEFAGDLPVVIKAPGPDLRNIMICLRSFHAETA